MTDKSDEPSSTDARRESAISDTSTEPDETRYSDALSRRTLLTGGAAGLATSLAGCSALENIQPVDNSESTPPFPETDNVDLLLGEVSLDAVSFQLDNFPRPYPESYTITVYRKPVLMDESAKVQIGQSQFSTFPVSDTQSVEIDWSGGMEIAQQLIFTIQRNVDDEPRELLRTENAMMAFENKARGETQVRVLGPTYLSGEAWSTGQNETTKTEIWYNEMDEPPFGIPALDRSKYDIQTADGDDWFDLYNIEMTAIVRTPVLGREFKTDDEGNIVGPYNDWTVVNLKLSALEYLEATFFNSSSTMKIFNPYDDWTVGDGSGFRDHEVSNKKDYGANVIITDNNFQKNDVSRVAQGAQAASDAFFRGVLHEELGEEPYNPNDLRIANPVKFAVGRGVGRRWAQEFIRAVGDKPYTDIYESMEYQQMTVLKAFIGSFTYGFTLGPYHASPEESVVNSFVRHATEDESDPADCVASTLLFISVASWMTGKHPLVIQVDEGNFYHVFAGFHDLERPDAVGETVGYNSLEGYSNNSPIGGYGAWEETPHESSEAGFTYTDVECTEPYPSLGFDRTSFDDRTRLTIAWSDITQDLELQTFIPMNEDWEPAVDGEIHASDNRWYRTLVFNPFDTQVPVAYFFEDERNR